ncbi:NAD(P)/FAD-dependent oxidoreductase [Methanoregula sp.]|uniref:NAD(P)/FAD-dependent oxidoreductase n=1 Tax=Methanoregula sp. TaxID=2052170 RepID=UPI002CDF69B5|nr:NAD(P)/FAD-dependent oxidoreductase [Methanoregula sp.]HVP96314.1 NAD(P)/FAD-dependent oxidoreductase [Methanoregula sp.]
MTQPYEGVLQRDGKTRAIVTRIPAGMVRPEDLETIASVARRYRIPVLKITSGQRFLLAGIAPEEVPSVIRELGTLAQPETAPCVKFVQACPGTECCKYGNQDAVALARATDAHFRHRRFPAKVKIGISGCPRCCGESHTRDIGIMGTNKGWTVLFGGNGGTRPRFGDVIAQSLSAAEALDCAERLMEYYRKQAKPHERTARFVERVGMDTIKDDVISIMPYVELAADR